jgi:hypothetical protein
MIWGDMSSDRASEQYPSVTVCNDCVSAEQSSGEESQIVTVSQYDSNLGDACEFCGKTSEEEAAEKTV